MNTSDVYTDINPLTYVLTTDTWDAMGHRWTTGLANYNFHIHYKSGKSNVEADALSRIHWKKGDETIQADSIQAIVTAALLDKGMTILKPLPAVLKPLSHFSHLSLMMP